jgi:hypothetical protein
VTRGRSAPRPDSAGDQRQVHQEALEFAGVVAGRHEPALLLQVLDGLLDPVAPRDQLRHGRGGPQRRLVAGVEEGACGQRPVGPRNARLLPGAVPGVVEHGAFGGQAPLLVVPPPRAAARVRERLADRHAAVLVEVALAAVQRLGEEPGEHRIEALGR